MEADTYLVKTFLNRAIVLVHSTEHFVTPRRNRLFLLYETTCFDGIKRFVRYRKHFVSL